MIALESVRAQCLVVGEDLGTAPEGLRPALQRRHIYGYKVLPFERDGPVYRPPETYPLRALACVATHDLPTLAGWWEGADLQEKSNLGLLAGERLAEARAERRRDKEALLEALDQTGMAQDVEPAGPLSDSLAAAIHAWLARAQSSLLVVQAEDLAGEREGVNLPGTHLERPNWRRRLSLSLPELWASSRCKAILSALQA